MKTCPDCGGPMLFPARPYLCENCEEYKDTRCVKDGYTRKYMVYGRSQLDRYLREIDPITDEETMNKED